MADKTPKQTKSQLVAEQNANIYEVLKQRALAVQEREKANQNRSFSILVAKDKLFFEQLEAFTNRLYKANPVKASGYALKKQNKTIKRELNLQISDTHIRACLDPRELPHKYDWQEEARRLAKICLETVEYKSQYRDTTALNLNIMGDIIQGILEHDPRDGAPLAEQVGAAMHLLSQMVIFFSQHFPKVNVRCTPGNHGRNVARHKARAMHQKWDAFEMHIYMNLKVLAQFLPNVTVELPYTPYYVYDTLGHHVLITHGDTFIEVGNPGSLINVKSVNQKIDTINAARPKGQLIEAVAVGHVHVASRIRLPSGVVLFTNGALIPPDGFMVNGIGRLESVCSQTLWESTEKYVAGDYRELTVDEETDKDASLDKIIKPFTGF